MQDANMQSVAQMMLNFLKRNTKPIKPNQTKYCMIMMDYGLFLHRTAVDNLVIYSDTDYADWGCPDTRKSTLGYAVFLGDNLIFLVL